MNAEPDETHPNNSQQLQLIAACAQSIGKVRAHNEDSIFVMTSLVANNNIYEPVGLYIVADGMGGHEQGEVASNIAVRKVAQDVIQNFILSRIEDNPDAQKPEPQDILEASVLAAHHTITEKAPGSGTTLTAALIFNRQLTIAHVGDTRLYLINPDHEATLLTRDHSLVKRMIELGHITEEQAAVHPQRNILYRALGQGEPFTPDISSLPLPVSGFIMLCSDGLWSLVPRAEIEQIISTNPAPEMAVQKLVDAANNAGGTDNISVILVKLPKAMEE